MGFVVELNVELQQQMEERPCPHPGHMCPRGLEHRVRMQGFVAAEPLGL